jgi:hypothetical protein
MTAVVAFAASASAQQDTGLDARLDALEAQVTAAEDVAAIKRLQRQYGYYVDKGLTSAYGYYLDENFWTISRSCSR